MNPFLTPPRIVLLLLLAGAVLAGFLLVPAGSELPIHWNIDGRVDGVAPRDIALLLPVAMVLFVWVVAALMRRVASSSEQAAGRHVADAAVTLVVGLAVLIAIVMVLAGTGQPVALPQTISIAFAILLLVLGNVLPKSQPNAFAGIRIPSTRGNPANWQATHRLAGILCIVAGIVLFAAAFLLSGAALMICLLACVLVPIVVAVVYSILLGRNS